MGRDRAVEEIEHTIGTRPLFPSLRPWVRGYVSIGRGGAAPQGSLGTDRPCILFRIQKV